MNKFFVGFIIFYSYFAAPLFAQPYENVTAAIRIQSEVSDGRYSIAEIAQMAKDNSVGVLILSDTLLRRWEYGLWPWRNLIKRIFEEKSVLRLGVENYLNIIDQTQKNNPGLIIVPAVEVSPFFHWEGSLFTRDGLSLFGWHKKMLIAGLKTAEDYKKLPIVANSARLPQRPVELLKLWPVIFLAWGFLLFIYPHRGIFSLKYGRYILIGFGLVSLVNNLNFSFSPYDSFHGGKGVSPYQYLIDYVKEKGGMVFWLHPETSYTREIQGIKVLTYPYKEDLARSVNYQGFTGMHTDIITATQPGDLWDEISTEYCRNKRNSPVWLIGESGFDGITRNDLLSTVTVMLLPRLGREEVLHALKDGKMYVKFNRSKNDLLVERFIVTDEKISKVGFMGDDLKISGRPRIEIKLSHKGNPEEEITLKLIRGGKVIQQVDAGADAFTWNFTDENLTPGEKTFYRIEIDGAPCKLISNPIFVTAEQGAP